MPRMLVRARRDRRRRDVCRRGAPALASAADAPRKPQARGLTGITQCVIFIGTMNQRLREIVRYRNRKLYEKSERRFVTLDDIARSVAQGDRIRVIAADTGDDITARILSRALASDRVSIPASSDAIALLLRAGSDAAETVAGVAERVGAAADGRRREDGRPAREDRRDVRARDAPPRDGPAGRGADRRRASSAAAASPGRKARACGTTSARSSARASPTSWDASATSSGRSLPGASPAVHAEIQELARRLDHLEALAAASFPKNAPSPTNHSRTNGRPSPARKKEKKT